jgi:hypothetical protein
LFVTCQAIALAKRPHVIVGTPGRVVDHLANTKGFSLKALKHLVLDEADKLLDMDFEQEIDQILKVRLLGCHCCCCRLHVGVSEAVLAVELTMTDACMVGCTWCVPQLLTGSSHWLHDTGHLPGIGWMVQWLIGCSVLLCRPYPVSAAHSCSQLL